MIYAWFLLTVLAGSQALQINTATGPTPPALPCPDSGCTGKDDGNYALEDYPNYFLQCIDHKAHCQACWPLTLYYKAECNQCLYKPSDPCYTTKSWVPEARYACPNDCPAKAPDFKGNIADTNQPKHYIACWNGVTVGCVNCPKPLEFNEAENACLWKGKYITEPTK